MEKEWSSKSSRLLKRFSIPMKNAATLIDFLFGSSQKRFRAFLSHTDQKKKAVRTILSHLPKHAVKCYNRLLNGKLAWNFLDVGSGSGELTVPLIKVFQKKSMSSLRTYVLDPSMEELKTLNEKLGSEGLKNAKNSYIHSRWEDFKPMIEFDFILASHTFYYLSKWQRSLQKMYNCLRKGGCICIILQSKSSDLYDFRSKFMAPARGKQYFKIGSSEEICKILDSLNIEYKQQMVKSYVTFKDCVKGLPASNLPKSRITYIHQETILLIEFFLRLPWIVIPSNIKKEIKDYLIKKKVRNKIVLTLIDGFIWILKN